MLVQTKPKPPGTPMKAVQFLGDPAVHPGIYKSESPRPHWRVGGEDHGGPEGSASSWLDIGDWIVGEGAALRVVSAEVLEREWQMVPGVEEAVSPPVAGPQAATEALASDLTEAQSEHVSRCPLDCRAQMALYLRQKVGVGFVRQNDCLEVPPIAIYVRDDPEFWIDCAETVEVAQERAATLGLAFDPVPA